jgi:predicted metal-dependent phosphotriesterase family hydrolase
LVKYGGWGYAHILKNIIPWLVNEGATDKQIRAMTVENPKRLLSY